MVVSNTRTRRRKDQLYACQTCFEVLTDENWSPSMQGATGYRPRYICKSCWTARQRRYEAKKDPEQTRKEKRESRQRREKSWTPKRREIERRRKYEIWVRKQYGLTLRDVDRMYDEQGGRCGICGTRQPRGRGGFHVDHCHSTNKVRGLLCAPCNMMLGLAEDSKEKLMKAMHYLETHKPVSFVRQMRRQRADHKPENRVQDGGKAY